MRADGEIDAPAYPMKRERPDTNAGPSFQTEFTCGEFTWFWVSKAPDLREAKPDTL